MPQDEPVLGPDFALGLPSEVSEDPGLAARIDRLIQNERFAVLSTQGGGQPYASLIAFAVSSDLSAAVFATPITTRKYRLLMECDRVALLFDTRSGGEKDMMKIEALTATGRAVRLQPGLERDRWAGLLIRRHPHLGSFVQSPTSAVFRIDIVRYFHVIRFQEVSQWRPDVRG